MNRSNWLVPGLIVAGVTLILISVWLPSLNLQLSSEKKNLARVTEQTGSAVLFNRDAAIEVPLKTGVSLRNNDSIRTAADSEVLVEWSEGGQFRLGQKSEVLLDQLDNGRSLAVIKTGELFIEKFGPNNFWIREGGQLYSAVDYALLDTKHSSYLKEAPPQADQNEQISQLEIESVLNGKKNDFFRCFGQLIQRNPQAAGQVLLSFTIEKTGTPSKVEISKSEINDPVFKACLAEVVARTRFRGFSGRPVATVFPLKFE